MLSIEYHDFISHEMKIVVSSIDKKLTEPGVKRHKEKLEDIIGQFVQLAKLGKEGRQSINSIASELESKIQTQPAKAALDALRNAFELFACGGLHLLYTRQENESWYPKIILTDILKPNDIHDLPDEITIYRGCDNDEFQSDRFGQAWTTSIDVARQFAFSHYISEHWFNRNTRIIAKTIYSRSNVLFSHQVGECEVVVDSNHLGTIEILT